MNWHELYRSLIRRLDGTTGRNRRALAKAREIAANDAAFRASVAAAGGPAGVKAAVARAAKDPDLSRSLISLAPADASDTAALARARARHEAPRYLRILPSTGPGISVLAVSPGQSVVIDLAPGGWVAWRGHDIETSAVWAPCQGFDAGLRIDTLSSADGAGGQYLARGSAWLVRRGEMDSRSVALTPGTEIRFWPGRIEVAG